MSEKFFEALRTVRCNPEENKECSKDRCFINGGECCSMEVEQDGAVDSVEMMLKMQAAFQRRVDPRCTSTDLQERAAFIRDHYVYLDQELQEMLYEVPYFKHWKDYSKMNYAELSAQKAKCKEELVDAWHFFMNLMIALDMSAEDLFTMYMAKHKENIRRQDEGYDHTMNHIGIQEEVQ